LSCGGTATTDPDFGPNVLIFDPSMADIQQKVDQIFDIQGNAQFGWDRYALLFKPGQYDVDVHVGFYTEVLGLGQSPDDVVLKGVRSTPYLGNNNATCNFWRLAENLAVDTQGGTNVWAVSQATGYRRMHIKGNLAFSDNGWSSGGFIADSKVDGTTYSGTQQQFFSRNDELNWDGGSWNQVFVGVKSAPGDNWPGGPYTNIDKTPVIREKPYLTIDGNGKYSVVVPSLKTDSQGYSWDGGGAAGCSVSIDQFYIAKPDTDTAASLNAALNQGKHLILTPGIYHVDSAIQITKPHTIVLGLGLATIIPDNGTPAMVVADVDGVSLAGLLLDAGKQESPTMIQLGEDGSSKDHSKDPTMLSDIFCRVGGAGAGKATSCMTVNSNNVLGDNFWLWRADHGDGVGWYDNPSKHGIIVNGNDVTMYGLFVEHFEEYQTLWNGENGRTYFYQSELPYDPPNQDAYRSPDGKDGYASYKVMDNVNNHEAWGLGVYSVFFSGPWHAENAIESPDKPGVKFHHMIMVQLAQGGIRNVINGQFNSNGQFSTKSDY
jgi:hypothetical protein